MLGCKSCPAVKISPAPQALSAAPPSQLLSKITLKSGVGTIVETGSDGPQGPGYPEAHALPPDRPGRQRRPASRVVFVVRVIS